MRLNQSTKSSALAVNRERRNCRRAVIALSLIGLAALGRSGRAEEAVNADTGFAVSMNTHGGLPGDRQKRQ